MKYVDYREALGCGFDDNDKFNSLRNKLIMFIKSLDEFVDYSNSDKNMFFIEIGVVPEGYKSFYDVELLLNHVENMKELICFFVMFSNIFNNTN